MVFFVWIEKHVFVLLRDYFLNIFKNEIYVLLT
nr:MAG TPA: hypothetical protein [Caudoviricetes sp.]DAR95459.1 MAG TPA: hypothetical protein [Caudoviricetes sp.]DAU84545.1 MAG TPA: hypothetical protein [Caudoviricetes sp.]DAW39674.1 MAG TPA: hypothetical protein [Caudoviricetes sp.]